MGVEVQKTTSQFLTSWLYCTQKLDNHEYFEVGINPPGSPPGFRTTSINQWKIKKLNNNQYQPVETINGLDIPLIIRGSLD
jgi:hypothetical protein